MPRFFFHLHDGRTIEDERGATLPDLEAARREAISRCGQFIAASPEAFCADHDWHMEVTDEAGLLLMRLDLDLALTESPSVRLGRR